MPHRTTIVVPCYNEAARLQAEAFVRFAAHTPDVRFLFVDDGSTDDTAQILGRLCALDPLRFALATSPVNVGQGEAVRLGVNLALDRGACYVGYWDADLAAPLEEIPRLVSVLDARPSCLCVLGSRRPVPDNRIARHPVRRVLGRLFARVATAVLGLPLYDTQCGAKLFRGSAEVAQLFARPFSSRWIFDVELLARLIRRRGSARAAHAAIFELPLRTWRDVAGSRLHAFDFAKAPLEMARIGRELHL